MSQTLAPILIAAILLGFAHNSLAQTCESSPSIVGHFKHVVLLNYDMQTSKFNLNIEVTPLHDQGTPSFQPGARGTLTIDSQKKVISLMVAGQKIGTLERDLKLSTFSGPVNGSDFLSCRVEGVHSPSASSLSCTWENPNCPEGYRCKFEWSEGPFLCKWK